MTNTLMKCVATLAVTLALAPEPASAQRLIPPAVPDDIQVPAGNKAFLIGHALGTQNYICQESASAPSGVAWVLFGPQATLFNEYGGEIMTHFLSPNPDEIVMARPTWQHSRDTSSVWARVVTGDASSDPNFVEEGAVAWLKLTVVGTEEGPDGGDTLAKTTFIQRLNTSGGLAPSNCRSKADVGRQAFVPYIADYFFYRAQALE